MHRKHYKQYNKANITKHVVLAAVDLKPLVLRDFLSEIYSDPGQMVRRGGGMDFMHSNFTQLSLSLSLSLSPLLSSPFPPSLPPSFPLGYTSSCTNKGRTS